MTTHTNTHIQYTDRWHDLTTALDIYGEFAEKYRDRLPEWSISEEEIARFGTEKKTQESFGFEWTVYSTVRDERDEVHVLEGGLTPTDGVGCGIRCGCVSKY